jgi:retron-type reverse transcriptase
VISLLSCLGKVVERAVTTYFASYCETNEIFHRGQFDCRWGRGTSDALAQLVAKVESAWSQKRIALALLLDVKGAFDRVDKQRLLRRMIQVGIAGNIVRWVDSFLSGRRAMLVIDRRTGETRSIQAGLPQGSPISPVLFILSISGMFQGFEDRHPRLQAISLVDDIGLVTEWDDLEEGTRKLEHIARDAIQWGAHNKVEFEVSKTEVVVFSRRRKILQATRLAAVRIRRQTFTIKQEATKWLGFRLDPKLLFKTHFENRMASAKGALQRISSLSRSSGGLSVNLMRRVAVAAVTSTAMYGSEIWWRGQKDRLEKVQLLLNSQARAITGLLRSTPRTFLWEASCLPTARDLLDHRQTRFAARALNADGDHPTHQLLPANFRFGDLHCHEGATGQQSSIGWMRPDKTH